MTYRLRNILIALGLAILAALLVTFYVANYKKHVQKQEVTVPVVVAAKDIPAGTSGADIIKGHYLTTESVSRQAVVPGALSNANLRKRNNQLVQVLNSLHRVSHQSPDDEWR